MLNELETEAKADYRWLLPPAANLDAQLRIEPSMNAHLFAKVAMGNRFFAALRFDTFVVKGGITQAANLSTVNAQVADEAYASDYALALEVSAGLASDAQDLFDFLSVNVAALELKYSLPLFESPKAQSVVADVDAFEAGDPVTFTVALSPATLDYLFLLTPTPYNVDEIVVYRKTSGAGPTVTTEEVARVAASPGQTTFQLPWTADAEGAVADGFYAFVDTKALTVPLVGGGIPFIDELELGKVTGPSEGPNRVTLTGVEVVHECELQTWNVAGTLLVDDRDYRTTVFGADGAPLPTGVTLGCTLQSSGVPRGSVDSTMTVLSATGPLAASLSMQGTAALSVLGDEARGQDLQFVDGELIARYTWTIELSKPHTFTLTTTAQGAPLSGVPYVPDSGEDYHFVLNDSFAVADLSGHPVAQSRSPEPEEDLTPVVGELGPGVHTLWVELEWDPEAASSKEPWSGSPSGSSSASLTLAPLE